MNFIESNGKDVFQFNQYYARKFELSTIEARYTVELYKRQIIFKTLMGLDFKYKYHKN